MTPNEGSLWAIDETPFRYEPISAVFLFGGTPLMSRLAAAIKNRFRVVMYTAPRQAAEVAEVDGVTRVVTSDINAETFPGTIGNALGIGLGEAWQFGTALRWAFRNRLVDFMSIPYPNYLGGAHMTHAILRGERRWGCCMQMVTENTKQGEVHDGAIIDQTTLVFPSDDEHRTLEDDYLAFLVEFVDKASRGNEFTPTRPMFPSRYYPRLNTERQGWINWDWHRLPLKRFIKAFDKPYPGARTVVFDGRNSHVVTVHDVLDMGASDSHPFHVGLVVERLGDRSTVQALGGLLGVIVRDDLGRVASWLQPGMRLMTDRATLEKALTYTPNYQPTGDANA